MYNRKTSAVQVTVTIIVNYNHNTFIVQATGLQIVLYFRSSMNQQMEQAPHMSKFHPPYIQ
jgi:hypothetical protein